MAEASQESSRNEREKEILYKLLDKLTPMPATPAASGADKKVAAFDVPHRALTDLKCEFRKVRAELGQERMRRAD